MKRKALRAEQPIEDMAISCLLEIDQREDEESGEWQRRSQANPRSKVRSFSSHGLNRHQNNSPRLSASRRYDQSEDKTRCLSKKAEGSSVEKNFRNTSMSVYNDINKFNEGQYWSARVNWMNGSDGDRVESQPKLNKKISFGYEVYSRKNSRKSKVGDDAERRRKSQYRTNLIYSLINNEEMKKLNKTSPSHVKYIKNKDNNSNPEVKQQNCIKNPVQDYMREVYNRVRQCHHQNQITRPSEHQRSVLIRQLLMNLGNIKNENYFNDRMSNPQSQIQDLKVARINHRRLYRPEQKNAQLLNKKIENQGKSPYKPPKSMAIFVNKK